MAALALTEADLLRVSRDLAYSELASMPGLKAKLGPRIVPAGQTLTWAADALDIDSLARMQLATAGAVWCNAYDAGFEDLFLAKRTAADWAVVMHRARAAGAAQFTFTTSGSTGARKHIRHREDLLALEAQAWAQVLGPVKRVVVLCPTHHIYGFIWGVLLPIALGVPVIDADVSDLPTLQAHDLVVAVPDQWAWLSASTRAWPAHVQGVSSTAPMPAAVHEAMTLAHGAPEAHDAANDHGPRLERLLQIYGSSETAGLAWRNSAAGAYALAPGRLRNAADGIDLLLPSGTRQAMAVQDELAWTGPDTFELLRRSDESVQVGGHNVSPAWVVAQLQAHSAVKEAAVRLATDTTPAKLKAFIVLQPAAQANTTPQRTDLEQWINATLPWYATFSSITYGSALPRNAMGKASDWQPN